MISMDYMTSQLDADTVLPIRNATSHSRVLSTWGTRTSWILRVHRGMSLTLWWHGWTLLEAAGDEPKLWLRMWTHLQIGTRGWIWAFRRLWSSSCPVSVQRLCFCSDKAIYFPSTHAVSEGANFSMGTQTFLEASTSPGNKQTAPVHVPSLYLLSHPLAGCTFSNVDMSSVSHHSVYVSLSCDQQCGSALVLYLIFLILMQIFRYLIHNRKIGSVQLSQQRQSGMFHMRGCFFLWGVGQIHAPKMDSLTVSSTLW